MCKDSNSASKKNQSLKFTVIHLTQEDQEKLLAIQAAFNCPTTSDLITNIIAFTFSLLHLLSRKAA